MQSSCAHFIHCWHRRGGSLVQVVTAKHFSLKFRIDRCKSNIKDIVFNIQNLSLLHDYLYYHLTLGGAIVIKTGLIFIILSII